MSDDQLTPAPLVRRAARGGANLLIFAAVLIPLWILAVPCMAANESRAAQAIGFYVALFALALVAGTGLHRGRGAVARGLLRWRLRRQLRNLLREHGIDERDHSERRRELERGFWRDQQHAALVALRQRFAEEPPRLDLLGATMIQLRASSFAIACAAGVGALAVVCAPVVTYLRNDYALPGLALGLGIGLGLTASVIFLTGWEGLRKQRATAAARQEFVKESRRIATMAELAGGLTLAEHEPDDALRGALSSDVAQPGALSEVDP